jgi:hypothetical protein
MMFKSGNTHEIAITLLLVGGHAVAAALLAGQTKIAIYESLGVGACVVIFIIIQELLTFVQKRLGGE